MANKGKVLLVAVESDFQQITVEVLHDEGYLCDVSSAVAPALALLRSNRYDVLIAEIGVPGNTSLELIHEISRFAQRPSVVLVAEAPCTAVESIHLPVFAYLIQPVQFDDLLDQVRLGVERSKTNRDVLHLLEQVQAWSQELEVAGQALSRLCTLLDAYAFLLLSEDDQGNSRMSQGDDVSTTLHALNEAWRRQN